MEGVVVMPFADWPPIWRFVAICLAALPVGTLVGAIVDLIVIQRRKRADNRRKEKPRR